MTTSTERDAEIIGKPQRVEPIATADMPADGRKVITEIRAALGIDDALPIPEYCLTVVRQPAIFRSHMEMGIAVFRGRLSLRDRELAILRTGWLAGAPFEWSEHVVLGKKIGIADAEIEAVIVGSTAPGWTPHEAAILRAVEELDSRRSISDETWAELAKTWDEAELVEFVMMAGHYVMTALVQNSLRVRLEPGKIGLAQR